MNQSTDLMAFFIEMFRRLSLKSPRFFQVLQAIGMIAALVTGIPLFIQQLEILAGIKIELPDVVNHWVVRVVFWCGVIVKLMAKLPVTQPPQEDGVVQPKSEALPYTEKKESTAVVSNLVSK